MMAASAVLRGECLYLLLVAVILLVSACVSLWFYVRAVNQLHAYERPRRFS